MCVCVCVCVCQVLYVAVLAYVVFECCLLEECEWICNMYMYVYMYMYVLMFCVYTSKHYIVYVCMIII